MSAHRGTTVLTGGHLIDPAQGIDGPADIVITDGVIAAVGKDVGGSAPDGAGRHDLGGKYVSPGWFDIHIHAYGMLGFADPDSIGIQQGVTAFIDAGGPGIAVMEEFAALLEKQLVTDLYAGPYIRPMGIIGAQYIEGDIRSLSSFPVTDWLDFMAEHPGLIRYLKVAALGSYKTGPLKMAKGLSEIIGVPLYSHIGEFQLQEVDPSVYEIFNISDPGDMITHLYHANDGKVLDENDRVMPIVRDAEKRGVIFDVGFGAFNFGWDLAEKCFEQDLRPHIISSDLQQFNVIGPAYSLAHIMGYFLHLGMTVPEVIAAVTSTPAKVLHMEDIVGTLSPGMPADITVFDVEDGEFVAMDTYETNRTINRRFVPDCAYKNGVRHQVDMTACQNEDNWVLQFAEDGVPDAVASLNGKQRQFLGALAGALEPLEWSYALDDINLEKAAELQAVFTRTAQRQGVPLGDALRATFSSVLKSPFTMQSGLVLLQLDKAFALDRFREIAGEQIAAAE